MPGVFAVSDRNEPQEVGERLGQMLQRARHHPWYVVDQVTDTARGVALGRVALGFATGEPQPVSSSDGAVSVVMDGELYDGDEQRRRLVQQGCRFSGTQSAEVLLHGYLCGGKRFFGGLHGKFVAVIWDAAHRRLIAVNDRFGMRPLYYACAPGKVLVASEIKSILTDPEVSRQPSLRGIAQFFTFGQYLGEDTSLESVRLVPAAGWVEFDLVHDQVRVEQTWRPRTTTLPSADRRETLDQLDQALLVAVARCVQGDRRLGISLSGGLDARTLLGLIDEDRVGITSVALGIEGCSDHRSSTQLAALVGCRHHNYVLRGDFLARFEDHLRAMVHLTDGQYLSQCIVMPTLSFYREVGIEVLIRGHAGELMHMTKAYNYSLDRAALSLSSAAELEDWVQAHLRAYMLNGVEGPLLAPRYGDALETLASESLRECLGESAEIEPPLQRIWHLFFRQRSRRETALSLVKFGSMVETRLPYLDNELVELLLAAPVELKLGETIQHHILGKRRPEFLRVVNVNTGARMGAGQFERALAGLRQKVLAKLRMPGYQPYERLGAWLRQELRPLVEEILLDDRSLGRGVFSPDTVRRIVQRHGDRKRNHTFLLLAMMVFELGQRMHVDREEPVAEPG